MLFRKKIFKQEALIRKALKEKNIDCSGLSIRVDHMRGINYVNDIELGIIYPDSFLHKSQKLHSLKKEYLFYFNGNMAKDGQRDNLMAPFMGFEDGKIIESNFGRKPLFKSWFNVFYYRGLAKAKYGLCPHQVDWPGPKEDMWTYRFIECCLVKSMPVVFEKTPLGENFISGFHIVSDVDLLNMHTEEESFSEKIEHNFKLAIDRFFLHGNDIEMFTGKSGL